MLLNKLEPCNRKRATQQARLCGITTFLWYRLVVGRVASQVQTEVRFLLPQQIGQVTALDCKSSLNTNCRIGLAVRGFKSLPTHKMELQDSCLENKAGTCRLYYKFHFMRSQFNGRMSAFQAEYEGSIPLLRSKYRCSSVGGERQIHILQVIGSIPIIGTIQNKVQ